MSDGLELGSVAASEAIIGDLYLTLRRALLRWATVTHQTPQPRMGYIGQHLTSVVTGHPGGRSGARGKDLVLGEGGHAEIKTCYRVDQLGKCLACGDVVASVEVACPSCASTRVRRNDDSKWLIGVRNEQELEELFDPRNYYLVLFDFVDLALPTTINARIYEVDPWIRGFSYCMVDYYFNIGTQSISHAPFNLWPFSLKFHLMLPKLIYHSVIEADDSIDTIVFPDARGTTRVEGPGPLPDYSQSRGLTVAAINGAAHELGVSLARTATKRERLTALQEARESNHWTDNQIASALAEGLYALRIKQHRAWLPADLHD